MHIDEQSGNRIPHTGFQHLARDLLTEIKTHLVNLMAVQAAKIHETLTEAAAVDHGHTFTRPKDVHDDSLHGAGA